MKGGQWRKSANEMLGHLFPRPTAKQSPVMGGRGRSIGPLTKGATVTSLEANGPFIKTETSVEKVFPIPPVPSTANINNLQCQEQLPCSLSGDIIFQVLAPIVLILALAFFWLYIKQKESQRNIMAKELVSETNFAKTTSEKGTQIEKDSTPPTMPTSPERQIEPAADAEMNNAWLEEKEELTSRMDELRRQLAEKESKMETLQLSLYLKDKAASQAPEASSAEELTSRTLQLEEATSKIDELSKVVSSLSEDLAESQGRENKQQLILAELESEAAKYQEMHLKVVAEHGCTIKELQARLDQAKLEQEQRQTAFEKQLSEKSTQVEAVQSQLEKMGAAKDKITKELEFTIDKQKLQMAAQLEQAKEEHEKTETDFAEQLSAKSTEFQVLQAQLDEMDTAKDEIIKKLESKIVDEKKKLLEQLDKATEDHKESQNKLEKQLATKSAAFEVLQCRIDELNAAKEKAVATTKSKMEDKLKNLMAQLDMAEKDHKESQNKLEKQLAAKSTELEALQAQFNKLNGASTVSTKELEVIVKDEKKKLLAEIDQANQEQEESQRKLEKQLASKSTELEALQIQICEINDKNNEAVEEMQSQGKKEIMDLIAQLDKARQQHEKKFGDLERQLATEFAKTLAVQSKLEAAEGARVSLSLELERIRHAGNTDSKVLQEELAVKTKQTEDLSSKIGAMEQEKEFLERKLEKTSMEAATNYDEIKEKLESETNIVKELQAKLNAAENERDKLKSRLEETRRSATSASKGVEQELSLLYDQLGDESKKVKDLKSKVEAVEIEKQELAADKERAETEKKAVEKEMKELWAEFNAAVKEKQELWAEIKRLIKGTKNVGELKKQCSADQERLKELETQVAALEKEKESLAEISDQLVSKDKVIEEMKQLLNYENAKVVGLRSKLTIFSETGDAEVDKLISKNAELVEMLQATKEKEEAFVGERERLMSNLTNVSLMLAESQSKVEILQAKEAKENSQHGKSLDGTHASLTDASERSAGGGLAGSMRGNRFRKFIQNRTGPLRKDSPASSTADASQSDHQA